MISIRRIRIGESSLYRDLRLQALKEDPYAFSATYDSALERTEEMWRAQADKSAVGSTQATFIVFYDEDPIGLSAVYQDSLIEEVMEIFQVWVSASARGKGLGKRLMDTVFEWANQNGYKRIIATISNTNQRALGFYSKCGFEVISKAEGEVRMIKETKSKRADHSTPNLAPPTS